MKKIYFFIFSLIFAVFLSIIPVSAYIPQVNVYVDDVPDSEYVLFLASDKEGDTESYLFYDPLKEEEYLDYEKIYLSFSYQDLKNAYLNVTLPEGYHLFVATYEFTGTEFNSVHVTKLDTFIVILCDKKTDTYYLSDIITNDGDTDYHYSATINGSALTVKHVSDKRGNGTIGWLALGIIISLVIEMGIIFLFEFEKKSYFIIGGVKLGIDFSLSLILYLVGLDVGVIIAIFVILAAIALESVIVQIFCKRSKAPEKNCIACTIVSKIPAVFILLVAWFLSLFF